MQRTNRCGIDLAICAEQVAQIYDDGHPVGKPIRFRLHAAGLKHLVDKVTHQVPNATPIQAVMEPTGMAWFPVANWLQAAAVEVIRVKGQRGFAQKVAFAQKVGVLHKKS